MDGGARGPRMRNNMIRLLADASLGLFGVAQLIDPIIAQIPGADGLSGWIQTFGALGLCGFMVFQNYRQSDALGKIIARKDEMLEAKDGQMVCITRDLMEAIQNNTLALGRIVESLNQRPCIIERPLTEVKEK